MCKFYLWIFLSLFFSINFVTLKAQKVEKYIAQGLTYAANHQHFEALICWELAYKKDKKNPQIVFGRAVALAETGQYEQSLTEFRKLRYRRRQADIYYYLGFLYQKTGGYKEANLYYRLFLKAAKKTNPRRHLAKLQLAQIPHSQRLILADANAVAVPLTGINSQYDDYNLRPHPRLDSLHLFSSNRPAALFKSSNPNLKNRATNASKISKNSNKRAQNSPKNSYAPDLNFNAWAAALNDANWATPAPLNTRYNSPKDDYFLGFLDNGYQIIYRTGDKLLIDNFAADTMRLALDFIPDLYRMEWAGDFFFYGERLLIFAAKAADSYGGVDLYWTWRNADETWTIPANLGAQINTEKDEKAPFLATDGRSLYFSSNRSESMGGFDVYKSYFEDKSLIWAVSAPLPAPINSVADDLYFQPQNDAVTAFLSSNRGGGRGGFDLYAIYLKKYLAEQEIFSNPASFAEVFLAKEADTLPRIAQKINTLAKAPKILYEISPIFYPTALVVSEDMRNQADILAKILSEKPHLQLFISSHADNQGERELELFICTKQSQMLANLLIELGINPKQIHLVGAGLAYPIAKNENYRQEPLLEGQQLNRRVEFALFDTQTSALLAAENEYFRLNSPQVSPLLYSPEGKNWEAAQQGVYYSIELKKTANLWRNEALKREENVYIYQPANSPDFSYLQGFYPTLAAAELATQNLQKRYKLTNISIKAFCGKKPIESKEIPNLVSKYPDLESYILYLQK